VTLASVTLDGSGRASFAASALVAGAHPFTAVYSGDGNFIVSASPTLSQAVAQAITNMSLSSSQNPSGSGQSVSFTATVSPIPPGSGIPTGEVTFKDGTTTLAAMQLNGSGQATFTTTTLALGPHSITASYSGDANFTAGGSPAVSQTVFAFLASGSFVIGDREAAVGTHVTFAGAQWDKVNNMSGGTAPAAFKGFADSTSATPPAIGGTWTGGTGNSPHPPASVPSYMAVLVSSSVTSSGSSITGNIVSIVIVKTDPGPTEMGTVVAVVAP
jgi:hypothetical protein